MVPHKPTDMTAKPASTSSGLAMNTPSVIFKEIFVPIARCSGVAFAMRSSVFGSSLIWFSTTVAMPILVATAANRMYPTSAMTMNGIHQLLLPRWISSKVFDGAVNVLETRCHWDRPGVAPAADCTSGSVMNSPRKPFLALPEIVPLDSGESINKFSQAHEQGPLTAK